MKNYRGNLLQLILSIVTIAVLSSCNNSIGNGVRDTSSQRATPALTIDNAGIVPVFGNVATSTKIYIHNHSKYPISDIQYNLSATNTQDSIQLFVNSVECGQILAGQSCALTITTPQVQINGYERDLLQSFGCMSKIKAPI